MVDEFVATITGASVAGAIGILTLIVQQHLDTRRKENEELLAPVLNYVLKLPESSPFEGLAEFPWDQQEPYRRLKLSARYGRPIRKLSNNLRTRAESFGAYQRFMSGERGERIEGSFESGLTKYIDLDGHVIDFRRMGVVDAGRVEARWVFQAIFPYMVKNMGHLDGAWREVTTSTNPSLYWTRILLSWLQANDTDALERLASYVLSEEALGEVKPLLERMLHDHESVLAQMELVRKLLERRLGIDSHNR